MPSTRIPKLCHHRASGRAVVRLNGKDIYCGKWGTKSARAEYDRMVAQWIAAGRELPEERVGLTVTGLAIRYRKWSKRHYRDADGVETSEVGCVRVVLRRLRHLYGREAASEFGPVKLKALRDSWISDGLARSTINANVGRVRRMFRWAVAEELLPPAAVQALDCVTGLQRGRTDARETEAVEPVSEDDMRAVLTRVSPQVAAIIETCWWSGMRPGEAVQMRTGDMDRSGDVWLYTPHRHKTQWRERERPIMLGPNAQRILRPWLRADPEAPLFQPREAEAQRNAERRASRQSPMTPSQRNRTRGNARRRAPGATYSTESLRRAIRRACKDAGIEPWAPNRLRHAAATRIRREVGLEGARVVLGHASSAITTCYAEVDQDRARGVMARLG